MKKLKRIPLSALVALLLATVLSLGETSHPSMVQAHTLAPTLTSALQVEHSKMCLDVIGGGTANGTKVQQWPCNGTGAQKWDDSNTSLHGYTLVNVASGKCLDVNGWSLDNGVQLQIWDCNGGDNQLWTMIGQVDLFGYAAIASVSGLDHGLNKCIDVSGWSQNAGAAVQQWDCTGGDNQDWQRA